MVVSNGTLNQSISLGKPTNIAKCDEIVGLKDKFIEDGIIMNKIAEFIKQNRKASGLTQEEFAIRSGLGLRFVRELEQGKKTVRMDKVNVALAMFGMEAVPGRKEE